jgi:phosphoglycerate dehydrogenase-like enzyme
VKVLYLGPEDGRQTVADELGGGFTVQHVRAERDTVLNEVRAAAVVFDASMKVRLDRPLLDAAPGLRLVITATTGADHIDSAALTARGIPLFTLKTEREFLRGITPAAELSWLLLLACARRLRAALRHVEQGGWDRELFPGTMLRGRTLGLIGCGRIGGWMARYARAFDMTVIGHDPFLSEFPVEVRAVGLPELLSSADFVSIHVHFSDATRGLLGAKELALMKDGAALINTSRGAIVDESALLAGLAAGKPAALGVDVLEGEPDIRDSRLWQYAQTHDNVTITPHIGGFSPDALASVLRHTAARIREHFAKAAA